MDVSVVDVLEAEIFGAGTDVSFFEPISFVVAIYLRQQHKAPKINLPFFVQQRSFNILLNNICSRLPILLLLFGIQYLFNLLYFITDSYALSTV